MDTKKIVQTVINKAWDDADYRKALVANPNQAIEMATGERVPERFDLVVTDQTDPETIYLNIPAQPNYDDMELSDEQLEQVAGGEIFFIATIVLSSIIPTTVAIGVEVGKDKGW
ncbi:MAG: NHLP leader peptide family RiPP precursor [Bacteroidota bacterium]